jgi:hypothetical protein
MPVADQQGLYDFTSSEGKDMVADRERSWVGFTQAIMWGAGVTIAVLLGLLFFVV